MWWSSVQCCGQENLKQEVASKSRPRPDQGKSHIAGHTYDKMWTFIKLIRNVHIIIKKTHQHTNKHQGLKSIQASSSTLTLTKHEMNPESSVPKPKRKNEADSYKTKTHSFAILCTIIVKLLWYTVGWIKCSRRCLPPTVRAVDCFPADVYHLHSPTLIPKLQALFPSSRQTNVGCLPVLSNSPTGHEWGIFIFRTLHAFNVMDRLYTFLAASFRMLNAAMWLALCTSVYLHFCALISYGKTNVLTGLTVFNRNSVKFLLYEKKWNCEIGTFDLVQCFLSWWLPQIHKYSIYILRTAALTNARRLARRATMQHTFTLIIIIHLSSNAKPNISAHVISLIMLLICWKVSMTLWMICHLCYNEQIQRVTVDWQTISYEM